MILRQITFQNRNTLNCLIAGLEKNSEGKSYPEFGYATYRLKIKVPDKHEDYRFRFSQIYSSTKVWVNGAFYFEKGKVDTTKRKSKPKFFVSHILANQLHYTKNDTLEIVI